MPRTSRLTLPIPMKPSARVVARDVLDGELDSALAFGGCCLLSAWLDLL